MSDLDNAINSINASAAKAENTATFLDDMSTFDDQSSVTNPNNGQTVASIPKQVKDRTDELFTTAESDINQAVSDAAQSAEDAQDAADSIGRYQGLWPDTGGNADKGDTYQTQVGGTPTGQYFTALQDTTVDPIGDDVNWREVVSTKSLGGLTNYQADSIADMISGLSLNSSVNLSSGDIWSVGATTYQCNTSTTPAPGGINDFTNLTEVELTNVAQNSEIETNRQNSNVQYGKLIDAPRIIAHQGFNQVSKTNTMMAFSTALNFGAQEIEMDIQVTSDGELVCFHDDTVDAETDGTGAISSLTLAQVRALKFTSLAGTFLEDDKIPLFSDLLDFAKVNNVFLWAEIKEYRTDADIQLIVDMIESKNMTGNLCLISSLTPDIQMVRSLNSEVAVGKVSGSFNQSVFDDLRALGNAWYHLNYTGIQADPTIPATIKNAGVGLVTFTIGSQFNVRKTKQANSNAFTTDWTIGRFF